jgi:hypothetical protein
MDAKRMDKRGFLVNFVQNLCQSVYSVCIRVLFPIMSIIYYRSGDFSLRSK